MPHSPTLPPTHASHHDIVLLTAPRLLGLIFNWGLLGLLTMQVYIYYLNFPRDPRIIKALVYSLYIIDWAQTCSATYDAFQWFVIGWGDVSALYGLYTTYLNVPMLSSIIGAVVQIFFGWRIWIISQSLALFALIIVLALLHLGGGAAATYFIYVNPMESTRTFWQVRAVGIRLGSSAVVDAVIACSMTYYLLQSREKSVGHMNNILTRLIRLTMETGALTAVAAVMDVVLFVTQHNGTHQISGVILGKLYTNSLLVLFNNRIIMAAKGLYRSEIPLSEGMGLRSPEHSSAQRASIQFVSHDGMGNGKDVESDEA